MSKRSRPHRPPRQSQAIPPGQVPVIDPNRQRQEQAQNEADIRRKVEGIAAQIFIESAPSAVIEELSDEKFDIKVEKLAERSIDAALIMGRELFGIQAQRQKPQVAPKRRPRVVTEEGGDQPKQE